MTALTLAALILAVFAATWRLTGEAHRRAHVARMRSAAPSASSACAEPADVAGLDPGVPAGSITSPNKRRTSGA